MMAEQGEGDENGDKKVTPNTQVMAEQGYGDENIGENVGENDPKHPGDGGAGRGDKLAFRMQSSHEGDH